MRNVGVFAVIGLLVLGAYWQWSRPHLYKRCASPTGAWFVSVYRSHVGLSVPVRVEVIARDGQVVFTEIIDARDTWRDVEDRYPDLVCEAGSARLGPGYWNGKESGWFTVPVPDQP